MNRRLVPMPPRKAMRAGPDQPVLVHHPPVINHPPEAWHHSVPYPYRFKWDGGWIFIAMLAAGGLVFQPLMVFAVWLCFRFPMTMTFFNGLLSGMLSSRRRRR